ncbi:hypothetical protein Fmac_025096 [Flemingia macrophylla]|uniref:Uncharacterized protein n=1 Tax=Flemingia macrophylla TaxID=520843 RepID=A0ABD1LR78_9FABA
MVSHRKSTISGQKKGVRANPQREEGGYSERLVAASVLRCSSSLRYGGDGFLHTYIDCLHIKKTDKSRMLVENAMDVDDSGKNSQEVIFNEKRVRKDRVRRLASGVLSSLHRKTCCE